MKYRRVLRRRYGHTVDRGKRITRQKLAEMMYPWGADSGSGLPAYAVASFYGHDGPRGPGKPYPDKTYVERAIAQVEKDAVAADHGAFGWTKKDAKDLRRIASGLRYYLARDYTGGA